MDASRPRRPYPSHPQGALPPSTPVTGAPPPDPRSSNAGGAELGFSSYYGHPALLAWRSR